MINFKTYVKMCKLFADEITQDTLGFQRRSLPQISDLNDFKNFLHKRGVSYAEKAILAKNLKPTQKHLNPEKIAKLLQSKDLTKKYVIVSKDNYILDGHHRWAVKAINNDKIDAIVVNLNLEDLLELVNSEYDKAFYKTLSA